MTNPSNPYDPPKAPLPAAATPQGAAAPVGEDPRRFLVFGLTWLSYVSYYFTRKNFSIVKATLQRTYGISTGALGWIDASYGAAYAVGQFIWGGVADRFGPRRVIGAGMLATAVCSLAFGASSSYWMFFAFFTLNGLAQATGWSPNIKAMDGWFAAKNRGLVMGVWTTNYTVGSFIANPVAREFMERVTWQWAFYGPAVPVAVVGGLVLLLLPEHRAARGAKEVHAGAAAEDDRERRAAQLELLKKPMLYALGASYFFMKLVRYFLWNWAPYYMETVLHYDGRTSAYAPLAFEVAGVAGAISLGWFSDRFAKGRRIPVAVVSIALLSVSLAAYGRVSTFGLGPNLLVLALIGFFLFGPDAMVSATAAQEVGGPRAAGLAAGIINGMGSLGQIVSGPLAGYAPKNDWSLLFVGLGVCSGLSVLLLLPFWNSSQQKKATA